MNASIELNDFPVEDTKGFQRLKALAHKEAGLVLLENKARMIQSRLRHRMRLLQCSDLYSYCDAVETDTTGIERRHMISALTTNVSGFFREPHHFEQLVSDLAPSMLNRLTHGEPVRIWSAGCSNGQEAYTIAMRLCEFDRRFETEDFRILATDIDLKVLQFGRAGVYDSQQVSGVEQGRRSAHFNVTNNRHENYFEVNESLKHLVVFKELNLIDVWPMKRRFDAIFCRNVVIYFDSETQEKLWKKFYSVMRDDALIFVGHSERISDPNFKSVGATTYAKTTH